MNIFIFHKNWVVSVTLVSSVCVDGVFDRNDVQDTPVTELKLFLKQRITIPCLSGPVHNVPT